MGQTCQSCGRPIENGSGPGRAAAYCSQACRQRAYRERRRPASVSASASDLIGEMDEATLDGIRAHLDSMRMTRRSPRIADIAALATFLASDAAQAITGTWINATAGMFPS